jgi:exodeoxyribonuclease VII large subunit
LESQKSISLKELQLLIKRAVETLPDTYWVVAEVNELRESSAGHCFMELVQKGEADESIEAKVSAHIWANLYRMIKPYFESATGSALSEGMKILVRVAVQYHELYGLRLNVLDIDPAYTVGEVALQRQKTIARLKDEGVYDMNRELMLPLLPRRVAVISSENAAGYGDFMKQLHENGFGYAFRTTLFAATMQGRDAEASIIAALEQIHTRADEFDVVAILRGGGSQSDLSCFDNYLLASNVAQFSLPVITGIGHDRDTSIVDMVAHTMQKTPTAAAEFLVKRFTEQDAYLAQRTEKLSDIWSAMLDNNEQQLHSYSARLALYAQQKIAKEKTAIEHYLPKRLWQVCTHKISSNYLIIKELSSKVALLNPQNILQRGYSITLKNGVALRSASEANKGDVLETVKKKKKIATTVN